MNLLKRCVIYVLTSLCALGSVGNAIAQQVNFLSKVLKILAPFSAGALTVTIARIYAEKR